MFTLHPRLVADTFDLGALELCQVLLMNDARFPWCILVPRLPDLRDFHEVPRDRRVALHDEIEWVSLALAKEIRTDKMNVAALGNVVPQLHVHVIARSTRDAAWPGPVWGVGTPEPYADAAPRLTALRQALGL